MFKKIKRYFSNPYYALGYDLIQSHPHWMPDKYYLSVLWKMVMGETIDWKTPETFCEKLQWLKLYDRKPIYTTLVDKYRVKRWVVDKIGEQYVIPTLAVFDSVDEIVLDNLPDRFVLKCNHDSGSVFICNDKGSFDLDSVKKRLAEALQKNFYWEAREWPYKNVRPLVLAEKYMEDVSGSLNDYKVMCFGGTPKIIQVHKGRNSGVHTQDLYDINWSLLDLNQKNCQLSNTSTVRPICLEEMLACSSVLSEGIPQVRVDWYVIQNRPYFGEMTFFDAGGYDEFVPKSMEYEIGSWITLPKR